MKLKKAKKKAKKLGYKYVYVDAADNILGSIDRPNITSFDTLFGSYLTWSINNTVIDYYTGSKWWTQTLRKVND